MTTKQDKRYVKIAPYLYACRGKRTCSFFTRLNGQYVSLGTDEEAARQKLYELGMGDPVPVTIEKMCKEYLQDQEELARLKSPDALASRTFKDYEQALHKKIIPVFGALDPRDFTPSMAAQYLMIQRKNGRAVRGNREIAALNSAFNFGMQQGYVDSNPCHGVRRNKELPRSRAVSIEEFQAMLRFAKSKGGSKYMAALIAAMVGLTGRRRAEIIRLKKSDLTESGIVATESKVKHGNIARKQLIAWTPLLQQIIEEAQSIHGKSEWLFPTKEGHAYTDHGFKTMWNRLMNDFIPEGSRSPRWFHAHDLRSMYVTEMLDLGLNPNTHKNEQTMRRVYDRRRVVEVIPLDLKEKK